MKSERRHELDQNALANWIEEKYKAIEPHLNWILGGIVLLVVIVIAVSVLSGEPEATKVARTQALFAGLDQASTSATDAPLTKLDEVAEKYAGTPTGNLANVIAGDFELDRGAQLCFTNREEATNVLGKAQEYYIKAIEGSRKPEIVQRATYGLARVEECEMRVDEAIKLYEQVTKKWPEGTYADAAQRRITDLSKPETVKFYSDFAKLPTPQMMPPTGMSPGGMPAGYVPSDPPVDLQSTLPMDTSTMGAGGPISTTPDPMSGGSLLDGGGLFDTQGPATSQPPVTTLTPSLFPEPGTTSPPTTPTPPITTPETTPAETVTPPATTTPPITTPETTPAATAETLTPPAVTTPEVPPTPETPAPPEMPKEN